MSTKIVSVQLTRDGFKQPWGFRLQGGREVNAPLSIQRVFIGSPSESHLHRGDVITRINEQDARYMDHAEALELLKNLGIQLKLEILRSSTGGAPTPSQSMWAPPTTARTSSPYRPVSPRPASPYRPVPSPTPSSQQQRQSQSLTAPGRVTVINDSGYKSPVLNYTIPVPASDRQTISQQVKQPPAADDGVFRSKPLITPSPKATHYKTTGTYLRRDQTASRPSAQSWQIKTKTPVGNDASWVKQHRVEVCQSTTPWANEQQSIKITKEVQWPPPKQTSYRAVSPIPPPKPESPQPWGQQMQQQPTSPQPWGQQMQQQQPTSPQPWGQQMQQQQPTSPQPWGQQMQQQPTSPQPWGQQIKQQPPFIPAQNGPTPLIAYAPQRPSSPAPPTQQWQPQPHSSFKPVNPSFNRPVPPATSPKPKWPPQNVSSSGPVTISVPAPDPSKHVVHSQYNSPLNLYSAQNVAATISGQTGVEPKVSGNIKQDFDVTKSPTYQLLMEEEARKKQHRSPPQDSEEGITQSKSFKLLQMWTGESEF